MRLSDEFRKSLAAKMASYQRSLAEDSSVAKEARNWLSGRGISTETASQYQIGLVNSEFDEYASYTGMLCFPYLTRYGGAVSFQLRSLHPAGDGEKRFYTPYPKRLYNPLALDAADKRGYVCICEGEIDTITLDALVGLPGECPAVGIPGADTWKGHPEWAELFRGYKRVYVFQDDDTAGEGLAKQILKDLDTAAVIKLPAKDVNETYLKHGPQVIRERING